MTRDRDVSGCCKVIVFGDVAVDWFVEVISADEPTAEYLLDPREPGVLGWKIREVTGGALLLAGLIDQACKRNSTVISPATGMSEANLAMAKPRLMHGLAHIEVVNRMAEAAARRWRITRLMYYARGGPDVQNGNGVLKPDESCLSATDTADALVLDVAGWGFRDAHDDHSWPRLLTSKPEQSCKLLIHKLSGNLVPSGGVPALWCRLEAIKDRFQQRVIIVSAEDLRRARMDIGRRLSWDRTVDDLLEFARNPTTVLGRLREFGDVIVRLDMDGALLIPTDNTKPHWLVCQPDAIEGDFAKSVARNLRHRHTSTVIGVTAAFVAAVTVALLHVPSDFEAAIRAGLKSARALYAAGMQERADRLELATDGIFDGPPLTTLTAIDVRTAATETLAEAAIGDRIDAFPAEYARKGQPALAGIPHLSLGALMAIAPAEIEQLRYLSDLFERHLAVTESKRPLCLAVFGRPGSGKSFAVKEIARHVAPDELQTQEVNLAQLAGPPDLVRAFHLARDTMLEGRTPLVFFDEFDCKTPNGKLSWLPYFLAPMQDGTFHDNGWTHSIRRAIFVFAGGTAHSLEAFKAFGAKPKYAGLKVSDFVSRLQGFLDVAGPDPQPDQSSDRFFRLRRAMLLRSLLLRLYPGLERADRELAIADEVLRAFLNVKQYHHGARSMEALVKMSSLMQGSDAFIRPMLPPGVQISLHADEESFLELVRE